MAYKCLNCGKKIESLPEGVVRCPVCGYRVVSKLRDNISKEIKAI